MKKNQNLELIERFENHLQIQGFHANSVNTYSQKVASYLAFCQKNDFDFLKRCEINHYTLSIREEKKLSPSSLNIHVSAVKQFYRFLNYADLSRVSVDSMSILTYKPKKRILNVRKDDIQKVMHYAQNVYDDRDIRKLYLNILYGTGVRPSEAASLRKQDFRVVEDRLMMNFYERKKDRRREVPFMNADSARAVLKCLENYREYFMLLPGVRRLQYFLEDISWSLDVYVTARAFRHDFAYRMLNEVGITVSQLQSLLGHSNPAMSMWYALVEPERLIDVAPKI